MGTSGKETTHLAELYITLRSTSGTAGIRKFSFIPTELTNSIRLASDNYKVEGKVRTTRYSIVIPTHFESEINVF